MNNDKDELAYIGHIQEAIGAIEKYLEGVDFEKFSQNGMIFDAVTRELEIIGEAANRISDDFQKQYPDIPWRKVIGMRNTITHEYFGINKRVIWKTCKENLPELEAIVNKILAEN